MKKVRMPGRSLFFDDRDYRRPQDSGAPDPGGVMVSPDIQTQLVSLLQALKAATQGDFSVRLPIEKNGVLYEIAETFNTLISFNEGMANEIARVSSIIGEEGELTESASLGAVAGSWAINVDSINSLINSLAQHTADVARVITGVAEGDLSRKMALEVAGRPIKGEFLRIGTTVNTMVDQLNSFASEVTRVAREVGVEGQLGGQVL
jgi:methyl-accepting chemotaxis protein